MRFAGRILGVVALAGAAFLLGQKYERDRANDGLYDTLNRVAHSQYALLDISLRTHHWVNKHHKDNPFCPECYDLLKRIGDHEREVGPGEANLGPKP